MNDLKLLLNRITISTLLLLFISQPIQLLADASNQLRNRCRFFTARYESRARTQGNDFADLFPCRDTDRDCNLSTAFCQSGDGGGGIFGNQLCATAFAQAGPNINTVATNAILGCTAGIDITDYYVQYLKNNKLAKSFFGKSELSYEQTINIQNNTYSIKNGNGNLSISKNYPGIVELKFTFWKAENDYENSIEDNTMSADKIFLQEYIRIRNNAVEISEGLKGNKAISITDIGDEISITLTNLEYNVKIPDNININDELVVNISSASDPDYSRIVKEETNKYSDQSIVAILPNPATDVLNIIPTSVIDEVVEINVFDASGAFVRSLYKGIFFNKDENVIVYISDLPSGTYLVTIIGESIRETKRIVVDR